MSDICLPVIGFGIGTRCASCDEEYLAVQRLIDGRHLGLTLHDRVDFPQLITVYQDFPGAEVL